MKTTRAALLNSFGNAICEVTTAQKSGPCRYYYQGTPDGTPVNTQLGRISRSQRHLRAAERAGDIGALLCRGVNDCAAE